MSDTLVIGVGNEFRGDDAAGLLVARALKARAPGSLSPGIRIVESSGEGTSLLSLWEDSSRVILVDALAGASLTPGSIHELDASVSSSLSSLGGAEIRCSSHAFGVREAIAMARELKRMPDELTLLGIAGSRFSLGSPLSPEVGAALPALIERTLEQCMKCR